MSNNTRSHFISKCIKMEVMQVIKTSSGKYVILGNISDALKEIGIWDPRFSNLDSGIKTLIAFEVKIGKAKSEGIWITKSIIGEGHDSYSGKTIEKIAIDDTIDIIVEVDDYKGRIKYFLPVTDTINHHGIDVCRYWKTDNGKLTVISNVAIGKSPILIKK